MGMILVEQEKRESSSCSKPFYILIGVLVCLFLGLALALFFANSSNKVEVTDQSTGQPEPEWDSVERLNLEEKGITLVRVLARRRCYIMPEVSDGKTKKPWVIVKDELNAESVEQIGGYWTTRFCEGLSTYLLKDPAKDLAHTQTITVNKRQAPAGGPPGAAQGGDMGGMNMGGSGSGAGAAGAGASAGGAQGSTAQPAAAGGAAQGAGGGRALKTNVNTEHRPSGLDFPIEQREPRCDDTILDCVISVGKTRTCFTWTNGVIKVDQQCVDQTHFKISMTKPPGRILKIAQEQWKICTERKMQGLNC